MSVEEFSGILSDSSKAIGERFRALFELRHIGGVRAIEGICCNFNDKSVLLKHELAYCLGQMQDPYANQMLVEILRNQHQEPMVRHEAAEALAAIGSDDVVNVLREFSNDDAIEVAETCQIAVDTMNWLNNHVSGDEKQLFNNIYKTVDPAPAFDSTTTTISELKVIYLNANNSLFDRYRAMFSLRNLRNDDASLILCEGFNDKSALFKHEIAFVLGQLQNTITIPALAKVLEDPTENLMVRHECAEALGAIASEQSVNILKQFLDDDEIVVKESCQVALDISTD